MRRAALLLALTALAACAGEGDRRTTDLDPVSRSADIVDRDVPALTGAEIAAYFKNSTLVHQGSSRLWHVYLDESGSMRGLSTVRETEGGQERAQGTWEATGEGLFCRQWRNDWAGGARHCARVYQRGNDYIFEEQGSDLGGESESRRTRLAGNPKNL